ncbi:MAG: thioredoxin-disulfide reductase [Candidatus Cloacimonadaceae bacterium]|jgi:thioredoxin reductase (NADPH)|nr:thioredoxin-disulfide reductase [Candidatus Cloacimonadota bacterium]
MLYDVMIIGSGPAGLSAGIYAARSGLKTVILERAIVGGQITSAHQVENYPGFPEAIEGFELTERMRQQAERFQAQFLDEEVTAIGMEGLCKIVETRENKYRTKALIVCTGASPRRLNVPGEERFMGRGVSYCATCDGALYRDKVVAVIGGGDSAVEEGIYLTHFARKVYIIHRRDELRAQKILQERAFQNPKIEFIWNSVVQEIQGTDKIEKLEIFNRQTQQISYLPVDGVFIYVGILPNNKLLESRINLDEAGFVYTDEFMHTNIPGVYAAGDIRHKVLRQVVTATSDGAIAAFNAEKWIRDNYEALEKDGAELSVE